MGKTIFSENEDFNKSAFLNWRTSSNEDIWNLIVLADGFLSSAIELAKKCIQVNKDKKADILIFPILHNANHGIELYLKSLIWILNKLTNSQYKIEGNHDIQQMFQTVQSKIRNYKDQQWLEDFNERNKILSNYIDELFVLIKPEGKQVDMDFSRYPITNKYEKHFYINNLDNVTIDLENFVEQFSQIKEALHERASYFFFQELKGEF